MVSYFEVYSVCGEVQKMMTIKGGGGVRNNWCLKIWLWFWPCPYISFGHSCLVLFCGALSYACHSFGV